MSNEVKKSLNAFFEAHQLPSQQSIARIRQGKVKHKKKRTPSVLLVLLTMATISCILLLTYNPSQISNRATSVVDIQGAVQQYMTEQEIAHYTVIFEEEEPLTLMLLDGHPLTKQQVKSLREQGIAVEEQFIWPRFSIATLLSVFVMLAGALIMLLLNQRNKRLKAYTPLILVLFTAVYAGLSLYMAEGYSGIPILLFLMLVEPVLVVLALIWTIRWEYKQKKAQDE